MMPSLTIHRFSAAYDRQSLWGTIPHILLDMGDIPGTNGYCDEEAQKEIRNRMSKAPFAGIHMLDSGNYHYMSYLRLLSAREPFALLVLDHHTDMQPPSFGNLLSCGGWVERAVEDLPLLQKVILAGPTVEAFETTDASLRERVLFFSQEELRRGTSGLLEAIRCLPPSLPLYLSLDKDILCREDAITDWDQGEMREEELIRLCEDIFLILEEKKECLLAFDICGDARESTGAGDEVNEEGNRRLLQLCRRHASVFA